LPNTGLKIYNYPKNLNFPLFRKSVFRKNYGK
jgi:hypothetical protein